MKFKLFEVRTIVYYRFFFSNYNEGDVRKKYFCSICPVIKPSKGNKHGRLEIQSWVIQNVFQILATTSKRRGSPVPAGKWTKTLMMFS